MKGGMNERGARCSSAGCSSHSFSSFAEPLDRSLPPPPPKAGGHAAATLSSGRRSEKRPGGSRAFPRWNRAFLLKGAGLA